MKTGETLSYCEEKTWEVVSLFFRKDIGLNFVGLVAVFHKYFISFLKANNNINFKNILLCWGDS